MNMVKSKVTISEICKKQNIMESDIRDFFMCVADALAHGEEVCIEGLGCFYLDVAKESIGFIPDNSGIVVKGLKWIYKSD